MYYDLVLVELTIICLSGFGMLCVMLAGAGSLGCHIQIKRGRIKAQDLELGSLWSNGWVTQVQRCVT